jgi:peptidase E
MSDGQPVYLFAGGRGKSIFSTFKVMGGLIKSFGKKNPRIAMIGVASLRDNRLVSFAMYALVRAYVRCRIEHAFIAPPDADLDKAREILNKADIIFFGGGDPDEGMRILQEKNMAGFLQGLIRQGKPCIGVSAGTIMLCEEWVQWSDPGNDASAELHACLAMAPVICDTHAEKEGWPELKAALKLKGEGAIGYGITSGAYLKAYPDGRLEAAAGPVVRFTKKNGIIVPLPDLLP